jgi:hypothetical protein
VADKDVTVERGQAVILLAAIHSRVTPRPTCGILAEALRGRP